VNTRFLISLRQVDLGAFVNAATAIAVMVYAAQQLTLAPSLAVIAGFLALCATGVMLHYSLMFLLSSVCFWTVRAEGIVWGYYNLFNLSRLPDAAFRPGMFKVVFTYILPMLLVANVPVKLIVDKLSSPLEMLLLVALTGACFAVSDAFWRFSVRRYTSASS
jgi:ABC-2 type transport system permease protein